MASAIQGFALMFQLALLILGVSVKLGLTPAPSLHEASPTPPAPIAHGAHALI